MRLLLRPLRSGTGIDIINNYTHRTHLRFIIKYLVEVDTSIAARRGELLDELTAVVR